MAAITSQTFHHVPVLDIPRGARVAAQVFLALGRGFARLFKASPARQVERSRAEEVAAVRALAERYARTDPGFAADLYAAAARHEGTGEH